MKKISYKFEIPVRLMYERANEENELETDFEYKYLEQFNESEKRDIFSRIQEGFNSCWLEQHISHESTLKDNVQTLRIVDMTVVGVVCEVIVNRKLKPAEIEELTKYISAQCSDGWGESMEQIEQVIDGEDCFIQTWWREDYFIEVLGSTKISTPKVKKPKNVYSQAVKMLVRETNADNIDTEDRFVIRIPKNELIKFFNETFKTNFVFPNDPAYPMKNHEELHKWLMEIKQKV